MVIAPLGIDRIGVGETFLAVDHDAQLVAGVETIGGIVLLTGTGSAIGDRDPGASQAHAARQCKRSEQTELAARMPRM